MPAPSGRRRLGWLAGAGTLLALAIHSNFITAPLVAAAVLGCAITAVRRGWRPLVAHLAVVSGSMLATTCAALSALLFGVADIFTPTWHSYHMIRDQTNLWHSPDPAWVLDAPHLLVPPTILLAWVASSWRQRKGVGRAELTVAVTAGLQLGAYVYLQFFNTEWVLEYYLYLYMSPLWACVCLLAAFVVVRLS